MSSNVAQGFLLIIKNQKSWVYLSPSELSAVADTYGCKDGCGQSTYLGLPLHGKPKSYSFWQPVIENLKISLALGHLLSYQREVGLPSSSNFV